MVGIYSIYNSKSKKYYIGESLNILNRWEEHLNDLRHREHKNKKLQFDYDLYGEESFEFKALLVFDGGLLDYSPIKLKVLLLIYENKFINKFDSLENGYNNEYTMKEVVAGRQGIKLGNKEIKKIKNKPLNISDKDIIKKIFKEELEKIKDGIIKEFGGILFFDMYNIKDIAVKFDISIEDLKKVLLSLNIIEFNNRVSSFKFNNNIVSEGQIKIEDKIGSTYITRFEFDYICSIIDEADIEQNIKIGDKIISEYREQKRNSRKSVNQTKVKTLKDPNNKQVKHDYIEVLDINSEYKFIENNIPPKADKFKEFVSNEYKLNLYYNNLISFMRETGILKYATYNEKRINIPTKEFENYFYYTVGCDNSISSGLLIRDEYKEVVADILKKEGLIE